MPTRIALSRRRLSDRLMRRRYIFAGVLLIGTVLLCCFVLNADNDVPEKSAAIREVYVQYAKKPVPPLERSERTESVRQEEVRPKPDLDRVETAASHAHRIATALRSGRTSDKELVFTTLLPELLQLDFSLAVRMVEKLEAWAWREEAVKCVVRAWADLNPAEAANWVARLPNIAERIVAMDHLCLRVASHDPAQAMTIAVRSRGGNWNDALLEQLVSVWAAKDYDAAAQWVARQPQGELRNKAYARLAMLRAEESPAEAAELVVDRIAPGQVQAEAAMSVLHRWILRDPAGAATWVTLFPDGDLRRRAEEELAGAARYQQSPTVAEAPY